ncbi:MAG: hypothetical protein PHV82_09120 [Victivallaceae bacterium]|nr:hypothetical protein [Victivallaceae bacterium]
MPTNTKTEKDISVQRKILLLAIAIALLVHGLLLALFVYKAPPRIYSAARTAGVTFMDLRNQDPAGRRQFLNWLEYHEPSLISAPDMKYGYNQLNPRTKFRDARPDIACRTVLPEGTKNSLKEFEDLKLHERPQTALPDNFVFHSFQRIPDILAKPAAGPAAPETEYPLIRRGDKILNLSLSEQLFEDSEKLKPEPMSIRYDFKHSRLLPRAEIIESSGNRDFDLRVLREFALHPEDIAGEEGEFTISIQWRKKEGNE